MSDLVSVCSLRVSDLVSVCSLCGYLCQESPRCFKEGVCGGDGVCSMPGRRAGHASSSFFFNGGPSVLLLYGGEIYASEESNERKLTDDIVTGWFDGSSVTWARMNLACPQSWSCPAPRRDMSISIIDSRGGSRLRMYMCVRLEIPEDSALNLCVRTCAQILRGMHTCLIGAEISCYDQTFVRTQSCGPNRTMIVAHCPTSGATFC